MGSPGPTMADALGGFATGQRAGLLNAYQNADMEKRQKRTALIAEAQSNKPDTDISPEAQKMRAALAGVSPEVRALADPSELPGVVLRQAEAAGQRMMPHWQPPTLLDPATEAQRLRIARGSQQPRDENFTLGAGDTRFGPGGRVLATGGPAKQLPMNEGNAWNVVTRLAPLAQAGQLDPNSDDGRAYLAAQAILTQPKPHNVVAEDGSTKLAMTEPNFPFPRLTVPGAAEGADGRTIKPPPPLTESQATSANYMNRMIEAEKRMEAALGGGYKPGGIRDAMAGSVPVVGNFLMSDKGQNYKQAQEDWVRAKLRKESGAVIAESEMIAEINAYFPKPGDSPEVIQQKAEARATAVQSIAIGAGRAGKNLPGAAAPAPRATPADPLGILK